MAKIIKQPVDDKGKLVYLSLNKAKYITIKEGDGNKYAKTGTQFLVWYDPVHWIRLGDGSEIESKYEGLYDVIYNEVSSSITNLRAHVDSRSFKEQKTQQEEEKKKLKASVDKAVDTTKKVQQQAKPTATTAPTPTPRPLPKAVVPPASTPQQRPLPSATPVSAMTEKSITSLAAFQWKHLTESEMLTMYTLWNKMQGRTGNIKKDFDRIKQNGGAELQEELDQFVLHGLVHKGAVPDNCIPPLSILKKIPEIAGNRDLYLYYERKLNKSGGVDENTPEGRLRKANIRGKEILKSSMPQSWKTALGAARLGTDILRVGGSKLASKMSSMVENMQSPLAGNSSVASAVQSPVTSSAPPTPSTAAAPNQSPLAGNSSVASTAAAPNQFPKPFGLSEQDKKINSEMFKLIGTGLVKIKDVLEKRLPTSSTTKAAENITFANQAELVDKTVDTVAPTAATSTQGTGKAEKPSGIAGLFATLRGLFTSLLSPLGLLKNGLGMLGGLLSKLPSLLSKLPGMGGLMRGLGAAGLVVGAGAAGYEAGKYLNEKLGLSEKISDVAISATGAGKLSPEAEKANSEQELRMKKKMLDAGVSSDVVNKWSVKESGGTLPPEYLSIIKSKQTQTQSAGVNVEAAPKNRSNVVDQTVAMSDSAKESKEESKMKQPILVNAPTTSANVATQSMSAPMTPRTSNSTFQRYNDSKTRLAY